MTDGNDPRVYFAAERTLLAWVRTGLAVIGLGFVVARFGLFLQIAGGGPPAPGGHLASTAIGVALVVLGSLAVALSAREHARFVGSLGPSERPPLRHLDWPIWFALALAFVGCGLAMYVLLKPV